MCLSLLVVVHQQSPSQVAEVQLHRHSDVDLLGVLGQIVVVMGCCVLRLLGYIVVALSGVRIGLIQVVGFERFGFGEILWVWGRSQVMDLVDEMASDVRCNHNNVNKQNSIYSRLNVPIQSNVWIG